MIAGRVQVEVDAEGFVVAVLHEGEPIPFDVLPLPPDSQIPRQRLHEYERMELIAGEAA